MKYKGGQKVWCRVKELPECHRKVTKAIMYYMKNKSAFNNLGQY